MVSLYQKWSKEGQPVNRWHGHGHPRLIDAHGEQSLAHVVRLHSRVAVIHMVVALTRTTDLNIVADQV